MGYEGDSFFTLTTSERAGLVLVALALWAAAIAVARRLPGPRGLRIAGALVLAWAVLWLSPQLFYLYYLAIFDGLPWQIVIGTPPTPLDLGRLLTFTGRETLAAHSQGVLLWSLVLVAGVSPGRGVRP
ncbi:hypothetical protein [uncultured Jannaschia sp.]|uniref:hypothetical protein n=1 Tax=uncultured Jannaschia sp. TaxID=293347 RepID=UPI0026097BCC|nr:hypothetical protein [uncultured Jannaschia sp.]